MFIKRLQSARLRLIFTGGQRRNKRSLCPCGVYILGARKYQGHISVQTARDSVVEEKQQVGKRTWHVLGWQGGSLRHEEGPSRAPSFFSKLPQPRPQPKSISQGSESRIVNPTFIPRALRAGTLQWGGTQKAPCAQPRDLQLPLARGRVRIPRPCPISLTQVSLQSQAKPDPRAKPAGVTTPSPQTSLLVPRKHCLCGQGPEHPS